MECWSWFWNNYFSKVQRCWKQSQWWIRHWRDIHCDYGKTFFSQSILTLYKAFKVEVFTVYILLYFGEILLRLPIRPWFGSGFCSKGTLLSELSSQNWQCNFKNNDRETLQNRAYRNESLIHAIFCINHISPIICRWKLVKHLDCFGDNRRTKDPRKIKLCSLDSVLHELS